MKKLTVILFTLLAMSLLFTACQNGTGEETTAPEGTEAEAETSTTEIKDEKGHYVYLEFPSNNENWKLSFDDVNHESKVLLTNGEKTFIYGDYRANEDITGYDLQFYPNDNKDSAELIVSSDEKYAAIIYAGTVFSVSEYESDRILLVSLEDGKSISHIDVNDTDILDANGLTVSILSDYKSDGFTPTSYATFLSASFEDNKLMIKAVLKTNDGKIELSADFVYDIAENMQDYMHYFVNYFHEPFTSNKDLSDKDILSLCFRFAFQNKESLDFVTENAELSLLYINGEKLQKAAELLVEETVSLKDFHSNMENWNADYSAETDTYTVGYATDYWGGDPYYLVEDEPLEITETEDTITVIAKVQYIPQLGTVENIRSLKYCFSKIEENGFVYFHINSISEL